jgi:archaeal chaperonin
MQTAQAFNVFSPNYEHIKGREAWRNNLRLTAFAAEQIRSTLGPNGAYKMVTYNRGPEKIVKITKDAVTVLEELAIQYPTLTVLSEAAKIQRQEVGDGVKSFVILAAELLKRADELVSKGVHPNLILKGYEEAVTKALETISLVSEPLSSCELDSILDSVDCGRSCLTPELRQMLLEATAIAMREGRFDKNRIRVIRKPGGCQLETKLIKGVVVKKSKLNPSMPEKLAKPRIALTSGRIGLNRLEVKMPSDGAFNMKFNITTPEDLVGCKEAEKQRKTDSLAKLGELKVNVLFSQQPIDDFSKCKLSERGVSAFSSVDQSDLALISKATGARLVGTLDDLEEKDVGFADNLEMDKIGLEDIAVLSGCDFATFMLRGSFLQALDELELLITNSTRLLQMVKQSNGKVSGGGAIEIQVARELKKFALQFSGREQLAVANFAEALMEMPRCVAANNGVNPDDALAQLGKFHSEGFSNYGLVSDGSCGKGCVEVSEVKKSTIRRAFEVASLLLRIDEQIIAKEMPKFHKQ